MCRDFNVTPDPLLNSSFLPTRETPFYHLYNYNMCGSVSMRKNVTTHYFLPAITPTQGLILFFFLFFDQWKLQKVSSSSFLPTTWSDNFPVCITIGDFPKSSSAYLWPLNTQILQSTLYVNTLRKTTLRTFSYQIRTQFLIPILYGLCIRLIIADLQYTLTTSLTP